MEYWARSEALALFWNDGIRKEHPKKEFNQFLPNIPLFQHSNIPICIMHRFAIWLHKQF
jgi:hypothetical protein